MTFSATGLPTGLSLDTSTGILSGTIGSSADASSPYITTLTATDGSYSRSQTFTWYVSGVIGTQQNSEGDTVALLVTFSPPDSPLWFTAANLPDGLSLTTVNGHSTLITGTIAAGAAANAPFTTTISASDVAPGQYGTYFSTQTFTWNVSSSLAVALAPIDDQANIEGDSVSLQLTGNSPSGLPLTFTATGLPDGLSLTTVDDYTAQITGTIAVGAAANAPFATIITVSNGTNSVSQTINWDVADNPPQLSNDGDQTVATGVPITLHEYDTDPHGVASVQWQISYDNGDYVTNPTLTTLTPQITFPTYGQYTMSVTVTNNLGETNYDSFNVTATEDTPVTASVTSPAPATKAARPPSTSPA